MVIIDRNVCMVEEATGHEQDIHGDDDTHVKERAILSMV